MGWPLEVTNCDLKFAWRPATALDAHSTSVASSQIVTSSLHGGRRYPPFAFTEHGVLMAANVLNSPNAIQMSVALVAAFIRLRETLAANTGMAKRLVEIEKTVLTHDDAALRDLYQKIRPLLLPPPDPPRRKIGFKSDD
jgi:hypothetical protein